MHKKLLALLTVPERKRASLLMGMIFIMAFLDMLGVASILPFMAVLANPEVVQTNAVLNTAFTTGRRIGIHTAEQFLFALGALVFVLLVASLSFKALTTYAQTRFILMREHSIGKRLLEGYLNQPYSWFLSRHSADLGKSILSEVKAVVDYGLSPLLNLLVHSTVTVALLGLILAVDPLLALTVGLFLGLAYWSIFLSTSGWLKRLGEARAVSNQERFMTVNEAFAAVKDLKVRGLEQVYVEKYTASSQVYAKGQTFALIVAQLPRYALEAVAFGGMLLIILYLMAKTGSISEALPIVTLYAFVGYRILPALQQIYSSLSQLRFVSPALDILYADLVCLPAVAAADVNIKVVPLEASITLSEVTYRYPDTERAALDRLTLTIPAYSKVGFVGTTGSGKTTAVDIILGLLQPQTGVLAVDGHPIDSSNVRMWQRKLGYVPQQIYLADDTIAANIAFGVNKKDIDYSAVERAARIANLHNFVINEMPEGYGTYVGERGVRISGGQRQRIGIARAVYHKPQVLVMDEATSALDNLTEKMVMEALDNLADQTTVIMIAHRLTTVRNCDQIYLIERGAVKAHGTFDELQQRNSDFRSMTGKG